MNITLIQIIFYLCLGILLYNITMSQHSIENFAPGPNIILIGNIFSARDHARYYSIKEQIIKNSKLHYGQVISIDDQCSTLDDFKKAISMLKRRNPELNSKNTYAFISIGFFDLIKNVNNCEKAVEVQPYGSPKAGLATKLPCITEGEIFNSWKEQLSYFNSNFPETNIVILSGYYLPKDKEITDCGLNLTPNKHLDQDIDAWNADLAQYCVTKDWGFIVMDKEFKASDVLSGEYELKNSAKKHLANIIQRKIY